MTLIGWKDVPLTKNVEQKGNSLKGIGKKTVRKEGFLLSNTLLIRFVSKWLEITVYVYIIFLNKIFSECKPLWPTLHTVLVLIDFFPV